MPRYSTHALRLLCGSVVGAAALGMAAVSASAAPVVHFDIGVNGGSGGPFNTSFSQVAVPSATPGVHNVNHVNGPHPGGLADAFGEWSINLWDFNVDDDPAGSGAAEGAFLGAVFSVTNTMPEGLTPGENVLQFSIYISMDIATPDPNTTFFGNGAMTLLGNGSGLNEVSAGDGPMWNFLIDGSDAASLFASGYSLGLTGPGTTSDSQNLSPAQTGPLAGIVPTSLGIRLDFMLTPGDTVNFNGAFRVIPAPGSVALLALAGLAGCGRRRQQQ